VLRCFRIPLQRWDRSCGLLCIICAKITSQTESTMRYSFPPHPPPTSAVGVYSRDRCEIAGRAQMGLVPQSRVTRRGRLTYTTKMYDPSHKAALPFVCPARQSQAEMVGGSPCSTVVRPTSRSLLSRSPALPIYLLSPSPSLSLSLSLSVLLLSLSQIPSSLKLFLSDFYPVRGALPARKTLSHPALSLSPSNQSLKISATLAQYDHSHYYCKLS
jgi:hypothetical protein